MGKLRPTKPGAPIFRPKPPIQANIISPRPTIPQRQTLVPPVRGASVNRVIAREIRRDAFKQGIIQKQTPPRYTVRPASPP